MIADCSDESIRLLLAELPELETEAEQLELAAEKALEASDFWGDASSLDRVNQMFWRAVRIAPDPDRNSRSPVAAPSVSAAWCHMVRAVLYQRWAERILLEADLEAEPSIDMEHDLETCESEIWEPLPRSPNSADRSDV